MKKTKLAFGITKTMKQKGKMTKSNVKLRKSKSILGAFYIAMLSLGKSSTGMLFVASSWLYSCMSADKDDRASVKQLSSIPSICR